MNLQPELNAYVQAKVSAFASISSTVSLDAPMPRTELDSHANMIVVGKNAFVFSRVNGRTCEVTPFSSDLGTVKEVPIVDAAIAYHCQFTNETFVLIVRNALYIPNMDHNLVPPFILREAGVIINNVPKIHVQDPTENDHAIVFPDESLRIPLQLNGIFSYFHTRMPTSQEIDECTKIIITPDSTDWDPHNESYALNEESMLDWHGNMMESRYRKRYIIERPLQDADIAAVSIASFESHIDENIAKAFSSMEVNPASGCESGAQIEASIFATSLNERLETAKVAMSLGSMDTGRVSNMFDADLFNSAEPSFFHMEDMKSALDDISVSAVDGGKPKGITPGMLAKIWRIDHDSAKRTLESTTQLNRQDASNSLSRQFTTNDRMLRYKRINSCFYTDTMFATESGTSSRGFPMCQVFVSDKGFVAVYPMRSRKEFKEALHQFCKEIGAPVTLVVDPAAENKSKEVRRFCHQVGTTLRILEENTQWANRAELYIGLLKESVRKDLRATNCPMVLWDFCIERRAKIHNLTPRNLFQLQGESPQTATFGVPGDISNLCNFTWYEWCYFREESNHKFPYPKEYLGRVLGPMKNEGNEMAQAILNAKGNVLPRRSVRHLTEAELHNEVEVKKRAAFDKRILARLGDSLSPPPKPKDADELEDMFDDPDIEDDEPIPEDPVDADGRSMFESSVTDLLINAEVLLPQGEKMQSAKVSRRVKDSNGKLIGSHDDNPMLNTSLYEVKFPDGAVKEYAANIIAENMYAQVDANGQTHTLLESIIDYAKDGHALTRDNMHVMSKSGTKRVRETTIGWKLLVRWKDGSEQWIPLKLLKETNPLDCAEFSVARDIQHEPAFCWWVPWTLKKRDRVIAGINSRVRKATHKYGIEVPTSVTHALRIDAKNGNTFWRDAIDKEMTNVAVAFQILDDGDNLAPGYSKSSGHLIFDVKMDFTRKARWVKDGHLTPDPEGSTYAGVVSRESIRIALTYAALNGIDVMAADIQNAFLQAPSTEKHYVVCGPEFGEHCGKRAIIKRALYGGKSAGADFWNHLREYMTHLGFKSCKADPDVWMRSAMKDDGTEYWEYVLLYCDDALVISHRAEDVLRNEIDRCFPLKPGSIGPPKIYLGNKVSKVTMENGVEAWAFSSGQYVQSAVSNVEDYLKARGLKFPAKAPAPFATGYRPEIDITEQLSPTDAAYYQSLVGVLRWIVELGRGDICVEVSMLASCMAMPRQGHLEQLFHMFAYLKAKHNAEMVFDPSEPEIDESLFEKQEWGNTVYGECSEDLPPDAPASRGHGFKMRAYVDSDHAGDTTNRRSRTGFLVFLNSAPIYWMSKKQTSIETSSFGSEFIAMKQCCEYIRGLRYKLRMMGIPCDFPAYIFGDNQSVLANTSRPHSVLKKKSSSIAFHYVREGVAKDEWRTTYINTHVNPADMFTKPLGGGEKRARFTSMILHHVYAEYTAQLNQNG